MHTYIHTYIHAYIHTCTHAGITANTPYKWGEAEPILIVNPDDVDLRGPPFGPFGGPFGDVL